MTNLIKTFAKDESGATAIEYGLIAALIGVAIVSIMSTLQGGLEGAFTNISNTLTNPS